MRYVITGGAGFIGSNLAKQILSKNEKVIVLDNLSTGSYKNIERLALHPNFTFVQCDITEMRVLDKILAHGDTIIHLAATVGVRKVCEDPFETVENNMAGIEAVLKAAVRFHSKLFFASSSEVYGQSLKPRLSEDDALMVFSNQGGRSSYVLSKLMGEHLCHNYFDRYQLPVVIGRFFNVAGVNQSPAYGMVVPTFIHQAMEGKPLTIFGDGSQQRSFCNVRDVGAAICTLMNCDNAFGHAVNIGNTDVITIKELAEFVGNEIGSAAGVRYLEMPVDRSDGKDIHSRTPCIDKITALSGWQPRISWKTTVREVINQVGEAYEFASVKVMPL